MIVTIEHVMNLWGRLVALRIDIQDAKAAGHDCACLELQALQVGLELRQAICGRLQ